MTRTRTQTTLTKLVELVANVHGELAFIEGRLAAGTGQPDEAATARFCAWLDRRHAELQMARDALYLTVQQFDPQLDPTTIGEAEDWLKPYGRGKSAQRRYLEQVRTSTR
jgi:hypothetical protein